MSKLSPKQAANKLLENHVAFEMDAFNAQSLTEWVEETLKDVWMHFDKTPLEAFVSAKTIIEGIQRNVVEREIPGAVAEVAGEGAASLFSADFHLQMKVNELVSTRQVEELIDKTLELKEHREAFMAKVVHQPIYADLVSDLMYRGIVRYIYDENVFSKKIPGVSSMLKFSTKMVNKTVPKLEGAVEENVKAFIADNISMLLRQSQSFLSETLTDEELKNIFLDIWQGVEGRELGELQSGIDTIDLTEFVVLGYEFWKSFRETEYFITCCRHIVDYLYEKYGAEPVSVLLSDFSVTPESILDEVSAFMPDILDSLKLSGFIESLIRQRLGAFYQSVGALDTLAEIIE